MVCIITDSTCDLGTTITSKANIHTVPLYVNINGTNYIDGVTITTPDLFKSVDETGLLPKTSAPTVADFQKALAVFDETICITLSSKLSATYQNALLAQEGLHRGESSDHRNFVIDSLNLSTGIGLLVLKAATMRDQGLPTAEIAARIQEMIPKVRTSFVVNTLDYLYKGGRCSAVQNIMGSLLSIRPIIAIRPDGTLGIKEKVRGSRMKALQAMLNSFAQDLANLDLDQVFVTHTSSDEDAEYLKSEILKLAPVRNVTITTAGSVIASHCGPGTIGILYMLK